MAHKPGDKRFGPRSPERAAKLRTYGFKTGKRATVVPVIEGLRAKLEKIHPHAAQIIHAYTNAILEGRPGEVDPVAIAAMAEKAIIRMMATEHIREKGLTVDDKYFDKKTGELVGERTKANPVFEHVRWLDEQLGYTASDLQISRKARGEGAKDAALTREMERRSRIAEFAQANPKRLPPAPEPIDSEVVTVTE